MRRLPLRRRGGTIVAFALVDDRDFDKANAHRWYRSSAGYACRSFPRGKKQYLHRFILGLESGSDREVDHIDGDRLNNIRTNLRVVTHAENSQNRSPVGRSPHRGVAWHAPTRKWRAFAKVAGQRHHIGSFDSELAAARAAADFRRERMPYANSARDVMREERPIQEAA